MVLYATVDGYIGVAKLYGDWWNKGMIGGFFPKDEVTHWKPLPEHPVI